MQENNLYKKYLTWQKENELLCIFKEHGTDLNYEGYCRLDVKYPENNKAAFMKFRRYVDYGYRKYNLDNATTEEAIKEMFLDYVKELAPKRDKQLEDANRKVQEYKEILNNIEKL